jgi:hypothetical protein
MNPSNKEASGLQSPPAMAEQATPVADSGEKAPGSAEQPAVTTEKAPVMRPAAAPPVSTIPLPLPRPIPVAAQPGDVSATTQVSTLLANADSDLIEKEWVDKAKQIVERTRDDPYKQSEELTVFKADYMKKRYGKTIKVSQ